MAVVTIEDIVDSPGLDKYSTKQKRESNAGYPQTCLNDFSMLPNMGIINNGIIL